MKEECEGYPFIFQMIDRDDSDEYLVETLQYKFKSSKSNRTYIVRVEEGIEQGVEIGLTKGQNKEKIAIAQKMLSAKLPYSQIIAFTGLTEEQLKDLQDKGFTI